MVTSRCIRDPLLGVTELHGKIQLFLAKNHPTMLFQVRNDEISAASNHSVGPRLLRGIGCSSSAYHFCPMEIDPVWSSRLTRLPQNGAEPVHHFGEGKSCWTTFRAF